MARSLATVDADLDTLRALRARGVGAVRMADGRSITYASLADLDAAIARVERERDTLAGSTPLRFVRLHARSGL